MRRYRRSGDGMSKFLAFLLLVGIALVGALGEYIGGRIILPAIGLTAPGYWVWFWLMVVAMAFGIPLNLLRGAVD